MKVPFIVAEIAQGYEGSAKLVELYVKAAAAAGADAVKFQAFLADELALPDYVHYELFKDLELPVEVWSSAVDSAHAAGLVFYSDVFGVQSLSMLESAGVDGYKVHTTDITNTVLLEAVSRTGKAVLLSTGGCTLDEIDRAVAILGGGELALLYGFQAEPTPAADNNLRKMAFLKARYGRPVGFMDHSEGGSPLALYLPFVALGLGAAVIEKHLTLSRVAEIEDYVSALTAEEFASWSASVREAAECFGQEGWQVTDQEAAYRTKVKRAATSARDIAEGETVTAEAVVSKRTGNPNAIYAIEQVIGRTTVRPVRASAAITEEDLA